MPRILRVPIPSVREVNWRSWGIRLALPAFVVCVVAYAANQLFTGDRGLVTWRVMRAQVAQLRSANAQLAADVATLQSTIARLKPNAQGRLDEDYLDELIRRTLPLTKPAELIVRDNPA